MRFIVKKTVETVIGQGNDLLVQVKDNQPSLRKILHDTTETVPASASHQTTDIGQHNRIEIRLTKVWDFPKARFECDSAWRMGHTLIEVTRNTDMFDTRQQCWCVRQETSLYFCTRQLTAEQASIAVRQHWGIENKLHHVRDRSLKEDASRIRKKPASMAILRSLTLNLLRHNQVENIADALYRNALTFKKLLKYQALLKN